MRIRPAIHQVIQAVCWITLLLLTSATGIQAQSDTPALPQISGTLAYIGNDYNVYTFTPASSQNSVQLTTDAAPSHRYIYPTWSDDNRLAYFCCDIQTSSTPVVEIYVSDTPDQSGTLIYNESEEIMTYAYWSPEACVDQPDCRDLAVLIGRATVAGFKVEIFHNTAGDTSAVAHDQVGTGSPFYFSWSPNGSQMLWQRNNRRMDVFSLADMSSRQLNQIPGGFAAPMWSPVDDRLLFGQLNTENLTTDLVVSEDDEITPLVERIGGLVAFNWSPDGKYIAYRILNRQGYGNLIVIDAKTGAEIATSSVDNVVSFFWSPDSQSIAYVTPDIRRSGTFDASYSPQQQNDRLELIWSVLSLTNGTSQRFSVFSPTPEMVYILTYFDQFAQSHRLWSSDSHALVYGEVTLEGEPSVSILDIAGHNAVPFSVASGVLGIWSYQ
ncbi:MAG TPA: hypothetical protein VHL11_22460 [Phototrophicaceae bacterium]|jgi:TolB protein|nr:hypothetical protein [Phototrophicaceae bacterium]